MKILQPFKNYFNKPEMDWGWKEWIVHIVFLPIYPLLPLIAIGLIISWMFLAYYIAYKIIFLVIEI